MSPLVADKHPPRVETAARMGKMVGMARAAGFALLGSSLLAACEADDAGAGAARGSRPPVIVELTELRVAPLRDVVALTGQLEAENAVLIQPEISGVIQSVDFEEGKPLKKGDVLFGLQDREQRALLAEARAELALARDVFDRTRKLERQDISSQARRAEATADLERAQARVELASLALQRTRIRAPFDGVAGLRRVAPGDRVNPDDGLVEIFAIDRLQLRFGIQEIGIPLARVGVPVAIRVAAWPDERFPGEVFFVAPALDAATRRLILKAWIDNRDHRLKPGMFANIDVEIARKEEALLVPEAALVYDRHGSYVWRVGEGGRAEKVPVEIGLRQAGHVEIVAGLSPGDVVVSAGTHKVMAGVLVREAESPAASHAGEGADAQAVEGADAHAGEGTGAQQGPRSES